MNRATLISLSLLLAACAGTSAQPTAAPAEATPVRPSAATPRATASGEEASALPTAAGREVTPGADGSEAALAAALDDLTGRIQVEPSGIEIVSVERVLWSDSSLGCPLPGMMYLQVLTDGFRILLRADGKLYPYHADSRGRVVLCDRQEAQGPFIPYSPAN